MLYTERRSFASSASVHKRSNLLFCGSVVSFITRRAAPRQRDKGRGKQDSARQRQ